MMHRLLVKSSVYCTMYTLVIMYLYSKAVHQMEEWKWKTNNKQKTEIKLVDHMFIENYHLLFFRFYIFIFMRSHL